jgi:hypothetical protein
MRETISLMLMSWGEERYFISTGMTMGWSRE